MLLREIKPTWKSLEVCILVPISIQVRVESGDGSRSQFVWLGWRVSLHAHAQSCPTLVTPWTVAHQASLSVGFPRQEYWSGLPFPPPGVLPDPGIKTVSPAFPALQVHSLPLNHRGSPLSPAFKLTPVGKLILLSSLSHWRRRQERRRLKKKPSGERQGSSHHNSLLLLCKFGDSVPWDVIACVRGGQPTHQSSSEKTLKGLYIIL